MFPFFGMVTWKHDKSPPSVGGGFVVNEKTKGTDAVAELPVYR